MYVMRRFELGYQSFVCYTINLSTNWNEILLCIILRLMDLLRTSIKLFDQWFLNILRSLEIAAINIFNIYCLPIVLHDMILLVNYIFILYMDMLQESLQKMLCQLYKLIIKFILMIINRTLWILGHCTMV